MPDEISGMGKTNGNDSLICKKKYDFNVKNINYGVP
jgi:hypothetical protein